MSPAVVVTADAWRGSKPAFRRAVVARALDTQDSAAIDAGVRRFDAALAGRATGATGATGGGGGCATGFCAADATPPDDGRVAGIDGVLDQIAGAMMRQARAEILPALREDPEMHQRIGRAVGRELARPTWVIAGATCLGFAVRIARGF